jgi:aminopeptidase N
MLLFRRAAAAALAIFLSTSVVFSGPVRGRAHHDLTIALDPATHRLTVSDTIRLPERPADGTVDFVLGGAYRLAPGQSAIRAIPLGADAAFFGINGTGEAVARQANVRRYRVRLQAGATSLSLRYEGVVDFGLSDAKEQYTRGFRETAGILGTEGVYLAGNGFWYPSFNRELLEFTLDVAQPDGWHVVSQGNGTSRGDGGHARWESAGPMDEIYLVGGPLQVFRDRAGSVETLVYLHERDEPLAAKYLAATSQYLEMYRQLIGPYPYGKFALVENFWETGYGMPTFTLLGREIIRFPFIINSSYPHEILHNWWGNSVFVDYESGNWCEGLTAYLADHLIQEQRGTGDEYRRATLQKYRDYVKEGRDFPLTAFRSRESASTEAVGYGKALMTFHMLRLAVGDAAFRKVVARFYHDFAGRRASFSDFEKTAEAVTGTDFSRFFRDWVGRAGAPSLAVGGVTVKGGQVVGTLRQVQGGEPFALDVPIVVLTAGGAVRQRVRLDAASREFAVPIADRPLALEVDPAFDLFRKLDPRETPPSAGQIFGEPQVLAVLPSKAGASELQAWRELFTGWTSGSHRIDMKLDSEVRDLPADRAVWVAGVDNRFAGRVLGQLPGLTVTAGRVDVDGEQMVLEGHTLVAVTRHPANLEKAVGLLAVRPVAAFAGLGRKLPHYGKYSYLGFEGDEPVNVIKGQWRQSDSPLRVELSSPSAAPGAASSERRRALAELPPVFSTRALTEHVAFLADPARVGRLPGTPGHEAAAKYVAERFKALGLAPGGDDGTYFQQFAMAVGRPAEAGGHEEPVKVANVVGCIPGTKSEWRDQSVVVSAHYDHLGLGWPDVHKGDEGKVHPGADDNASGVAVLLELARVLAAEPKPSRTIVFVAFTGEEAGLAGSTYYAEHATRFPVSKVIGAINLDTVGRLNDQKLSVLGTGTATEWQHIFRGAGFVTGVDSRNVAESIQSSDQVSFVRKGVPAVQIFSGATPDYHRPSDTADKIDVPGLVKVAAFTREGVAYLAERAEPLTSAIAGAGGAPAATARPAAAGAARRASLGTVPDFGFEGPGVRVSSVVPASAAEKAGVQAGDVLVSIDGKPIANLQAYSDLLRGLAPGQTVPAVVRRAGKDVELTVVLGER